MGVFLINFQNKISDLTEAELSAFEALDNKPELLLSLNLTELADQLYSSNSTLIRLSQKLGFAGFRDFKLAATQLIEQDSQPSNADLIDQYHDFFDRLCLTDNSNKLDYFAKQIYEAKNIFIVGLGLTKPIAEYMSKHLYQLDRASIYVYESHMLDLLPNLVKRGDLVLLFSMSGETQSLLDAARKLPRTGCMILSLTNTRQNSLNRLAKLSLSSDVPANFHHNYDITSRGFLLMAADMILEIYLKKYIM